MNKKGLCTILLAGMLLFGNTVNLLAAPDEEMLSAQFAVSHEFAQVSDTGEELGEEAEQAVADAADLFAPAAPVSIKNGVFRYQSPISKTRDFSYTFNYDDSWLYSNNSSDRYKLMQTAVRVSLAAFGSAAEKEYGPGNIKDMMDKMGYKYTDSSVNYEEPKYDFNDPASDTIGSAIGLKNIKAADGSTKSVILVAVRGGGYTLELGLNFRAGSASSNEHEGFRMAADKVERRLAEFVSQNKAYISDDLKIWMVGYSRGAAVVNLMAYDLTTGACSIDGISQDDVLAYCFECPRVVVGSDAYTSVEKNIINIINPTDFVPKVMFKGWGFSRHGTTYYVPSKETTLFYELRYKNSVKAIYRDLCNYNGIPFKNDYVNEAIGQASILDEFNDHFSGVLKRNMYDSALQKAFMDVFVFSQGGITAPNWREAFNAVLDLRGAVLSQPLRTASFIALFSMGNPSFGVSAHYPELCMAWVDSLRTMSNYKTVENSLYRRIFVMNPVNVSVYNSAGVLVGKLEDGVSDEAENEVVLRMNEDGGKVIILPIDEEFTVELEAIQDTDISYTVEEYNYDTNDTERVVQYSNVAAEEGEVLLGLVGAVQADAGTRYELVLGSTDTVIEPDNDTVSKPDETTVIDVVQDGNRAKIEAFVTRLYENILSREPDNGGLNAWTNALINKETTGAKVIYRFVYSDEFQNKPLDDEAFITAMYETILNRKPDVGGLYSWANVLKSGYTRKKVLQGFLNSDEMRSLCRSVGIDPGSYYSDDVMDVHSNITRFVSRMYNYCLQRDPDAPGIRSWVTELVGGSATGRDVAEGFFYSKEMEQRKVDARDFVIIAYRALLDREPDADGLRAWTSLLERNNDRVEIVEGFIRSDEFRGMCDMFGIVSGTEPW